MSLVPVSLNAAHEHPRLISRQAPQAALQAAAGCDRRALPRVRAGRQVPLRAEPPLHAGGRAEGNAARAARPSRRRARGDRAGELPRHRQCRHARLHRLRSQALSRRRHRRRQLHATPTTTGSHAGGVRGVRFNFVKHLGGAPDMGVFNRVIDRIKGRGWHVVLHLDAPDIVPLVRHDPRSCRCLSSSTTWAACRRRPASSSRRCARCSSFHGWKTAGSRCAAPSAFPCRLTTRRCRSPMRWSRRRPTRVLWGTDFPHPNATHEADEADLVDLVPQYRRRRAGAEAPAGGQSGQALWFRLTATKNVREDSRGGFDMQQRICAPLAGAAGGLALALAPLPRRRRNGRTSR